VVDRPGGLSYHGAVSKRDGLILFLAFAVLFLLLNAGAYRGYFQDDEIDNLSWTPYLGPADFLKGAVTPLFQANNFRPVGHYYFHALEEVAGLSFPPYVAVLHALHLLNVWLLWLVIRRLGAAAFVAATACLFFGIHMALFDNVWKPMYVFDVLCATFCLLSLWCYAARRWVLSFVAFWLAYKSKELAVMLPVVLLAYEVWFGQRRWKILAPFFLTSLSFGVQGMLGNPNRDNDYTFRFTWAALAKTSQFYAGRVFLLPYAGIDAATACVARLRDVVLAQPFPTSAGSLRLTFSAGIASHRADETVAGMLRRADEALYRAKSAGRDRIEVAPA